jgi:RNA polymerase sigma-70 factor (ECF subfamily)
VSDLRSLPEAELVARCAAGEEAAWIAFVERYGVLLAALARRMLLRLVRVASDSDVDEVVAEVFLALLRRERLLLKRYDPTFRVSTYLGVICRSEVGRWARRRGRAAALPLPADDLAPASTAAGPPQALAAREREAALRAVHTALEALAPRDRLLLSMRFLDGLDYRAIGAALGLNPESVGQLLTRAKARLAEHLPHLRHLDREP